MKFKRFLLLFVFTFFMVISITNVSAENTSIVSNIIEEQNKIVGEIPINEIASKYGGGGHKYASGARLKSWIDADNLIKDLDEITSTYSTK